MGVRRRSQLRWTMRSDEIAIGFDLINKIDQSR
jgi:hypothetical protein